jgi:hypothetical protein
VTPSLKPTMIICWHELWHVIRATAYRLAMSRGSIERLRAARGMRPPADRGQDSSVFDVGFVVATVHATARFRSQDWVSAGRIEPSW